jgi:hypothetical protein
MGKGGGNSVGYFSLLAIGLLLGLFRARPKGGGGGWLLLGVFLLMFPFILSGSRVGLPILGVFLFWLFFKNPFARPGQTILACVIAGAVAVGVLYYVHRVLVDSEDIFTVTLNLRAETDPTSVGRLSYYGISWEVLHEHAWSPLIGTGPATYFSMAGRRFLPPLAVAYSYRTKLTLPPSGILGTGVEYGYLGLASFYWIIFSLFNIAKTVWRKTTDPFWEGVARGYVVGMLLFSIVPLVTNIWEFQVFAFEIGGVAYRAHIDQRAGQEGADVAEFDGETAFDLAVDTTDDGLVGLVGLLEYLPGLVSFGLFTGEPGCAITVFDGIQRHFDLVADSDLDLTVRVQELGTGYDAFGFQASIDDNCFGRDVHNGADDDGAGTQLGIGEALLK